MQIIHIKNGAPTEMETGTWLLIIHHPVSLCIAIYFSAPDYADNFPPSSFSFFTFLF